ncbi:transcriptional regulator [Streptomyces platensis]|uniref:transcriptional regulator n=1 Tax=Streptomyces platensis TaxID=58346 RepID=UPI00386AFDA8|nr:helix-turn-helix domain-containing protein [Streptomyces platensis]
MSAVAAPAAVMVPAPRLSADDGGAVDVLPGLYVPEARQWLSTTSGRVAPEGYSWMQAVHWVAGSGLYEPRRHRSHGPRSFGTTTVFIAQMLAELSPCRPGLAYLMRRTGLSERAVEYHLAMLREAGLLAYVVRGTRVRGEQAQASEFAWTIPTEFDVALGIRTAGDGTERRMTGMAEAGRVLMARLAKKASRRVRRPRSKPPSKSPSKSPSKAARGGADGASGTAVSGGSRCTPMGGGADGSSTAGATYSPPESKLASGASKSPTPKKSKAKAGRRTLNRVGRRYQLARELTEELDWLRGCSVPRIAWVARHIADAGWSTTDVHAWLAFRGEAARVRRASGLLATLLKDAEKILDTPEKRQLAREQWRAGQEAARRERIQQVRARHERFEGDWQPPTSRAVQQQVDAAFAAVREVASGRTRFDADPGQALPDLPDGVASLDEAEIAQARAEAAQRLALGDTDVIEDAVAAMGPELAEQLYGRTLLRRARQLAAGSRSTLMTFGCR